jgi:hypothetical protein
MSLILYAKDQDATGMGLQRVIESLVAEGQVTIYTDMEGLMRRLRKPRGDLQIAVLLASTGQDLDGLLSIGHVLWDLRIILVLPDREAETISKGHSLRPRFLTFSDGNIEDIGAVLRKMLDVTDSERQSMRM